MIGIIACTRECNLRCKYCFEEEGFKTPNFSVEKVNNEFVNSYSFIEKFVDGVISYNEFNGCRTSEFIFHGGEPLLIYPSNLEKIFTYIKKYCHTVISIQTNGTIINDEIIKLLKKYQVTVGVSIDGYQKTHDENRITNSGRGTHELVMRNINLLKSNQIHVGALATITHSCAIDPKGFYEFYRDNNLNFSFNACYCSPSSCNQNNKLSNEEYSCFLTTLFDLWVNDDKGSIMIGPFERIIRAMINKDEDMHVCQYIENCSEKIITCSVDGMLYRCLHFFNLQEKALGNLRINTVMEIISNNNRDKERWDILKNSSCYGCDIQEYCYGGCPYWAEAEKLTSLSKDYTCKSQKEIVKHIYAQIMNVAKRRVKP